MTADKLDSWLDADVPPAAGTRRIMIAGQKKIAGNGPDVQLIPQAASVDGINIHENALRREILEIGRRVAPVAGHQILGTDSADG